MTKPKRLPIVAEVQEASGFLYRKFRDLGSKFRHETRFNEAAAALGSRRPKRTLIPLRKTEKDFP